MIKKIPEIWIIILIVCFVIFHEPIVILFSNINLLFKTDNRIALIEKGYEDRLNNLKKEISDYESNSNLEISKDKSLVLSKLSLRDIYDFYDYLIINTSTKVNVGDAVINEKGLVGIIESNDLKSAKVSLITGQNKISVKVNNSYGLLGNYDKRNKVFLISNINNYEKINIGDTVTTSGLSNLPDNIYIGKVSEIKMKGIEQLVYVKPDVNFDNLNYLYVLDSK